MSTLIETITLIQKFKKDKEFKMYSPAYGPVKLRGIVANNIEVYDSNQKLFSFDAYGRIHPQGKCLLFPDTGQTWEAYKNSIIDSYYDSLLRIGDVCLVKKDENDDWSLAIYDGKLDGKHKAKRGVDVEYFKYCISYPENSSYLGRAMFPDWMIPEEDGI